MSESAKVQNLIWVAKHVTVVLAIWIVFLEHFNGTAIWQLQSVSQKGTATAYKLMKERFCYLLIEYIEEW